MRNSNRREETGRSYNTKPADLRPEMKSGTQREDNSSVFSCAGKTKMTAKVYALILTLMMTFASMIPAATLGDGSFVYAEQKTVGSWSELQEAINDAASGDTIVISRNIVAKPASGAEQKSLVLGGKSLTIRGPLSGDPVYIFRDPSDADFPIFDVDSDDTLTLGDNLVLTGKTGTCQDVVAAADKGFKVVYHNGGIGNAAKVTDPYTFTAGQNVIKDPADLTSANWGPPEKGLEFVEWEFYSHNGHATKKATQTWNVPNNPPDGTMTLVAKWIRPANKEFKVILSNGLDGEAKQTKTAGSYTANTPLVFNLSDEEKESWSPGSSYKFAGWQWPAFGGYEAGYSTSGDTGLTVPQNTYGTVTLVARWEKYNSSKSYDWSGCIQDGKLNPTPNYQWGSNRAFMISVKTAGNSVDSATWQQRFYAPYYGSTPYLKVGDLSVDGSTTFSELTWSVTLDGDSYDSSYTNYVHDNWNPLNHPEDDTFKTMMWEFVDYKEDPQGEYWYHIRSASNGKYLAMGDKHTEGYFKITLIDEEDLAASGNEAYWNFASGNYGTYLKLKAHAGSNTAYYLQPADIHGGSSSTPNTGLRRTVPMLVWGTGHPINSMYWANITDNNNSPTGNYYDNGSAVGWEENTSSDFTDCDTKDNHEWESAPTSQKCDGNETIPTYSTTNPSGTIKFTGGSGIDEPKAFFVNVKNGGELRVTGAAFEDFITDASVKNSAPIVVTGGSTLNMSSGEIRNNTIGYGANEEQDSQEDIQQLGVLIRNTDPTNTAGGVIFSGSGTKGEFTGSAKIQGNRADAGALIVTDGADVTMKESTKTSGKYNLEFKNNVGWHHSGAVLVEHSGKFTLKDGSINNNVAWYKGGAVWATQFGTIGLVRWNKYPTSMQHSQEVRDSRGHGEFIMEGGELDSNFAFARAGAIEVESDGVVLTGGTISNNKCKSLGGAIYVEGDSPIYSYTLRIQSGYISGNKAYPARAVDELDKKLVNGKLEKGEAYSGSRGGIHRDGDWADWGDKHSGDGGGIWLCAMGGTSVFTSNDSTAKVIIRGNEASTVGDTAKNNGWGDDFYVSHRHGSALIQNLLGDWYGDGEEPATGTKIDTSDENGTIIKGPKGMKNWASETSAPGVQIIGNKSRNGGAIAANGTIILGEATDVYRYEAEFDIEKEWSGVPEAEVTLSLQYLYDEDGDGTKEEYPLMQNGMTSTDNESAPVPYSVTLNGSDGEQGSSGNELIRKTGAYKAKAIIPPSTQHTKQNGEVVEVPLYKIKNKDTETGEKIISGAGDYIDVNNMKHVEALFNYINLKGTEDVNLEIEWFITIKEEGDNYKPSLSDGTATATNSLANTKLLVNPDNGSVINEGSFKVFFSTVTFNQTITNSQKTYDVELTKVRSDNKEKPVKGTKFIVTEIKRDNEGTSSVSNDFRVAHAAGNWNTSDTTKTILDVSEKDGNGQLVVYESDKDGKFTVENLKPGTRYFLFEYEPHAGYEAVSSPWLLDVASDGTILVLAIDPNAKYNNKSVLNKVKRNRNSSDNLQDFAVKDSSKNSIYRTYWPVTWYYNSSDNGKTIGNAKNPLTDKKLTNDVVDLKITKMGRDNQPVSGAKFAFADVNYKNGSTTQISYVNSGIIKNNAATGSNAPKLIIESDSDGKIDLTQLIKSLNESGNSGRGQGRMMDSESIHVLMFEVSVSSDYRQKTVPWLVNIKKDGSVKVYEYSNPYLYSSSPISANGSFTAPSLGTNLNLSDYNYPGNPVSTGNFSQNATVYNDNKIKLTKTDTSGNAITDNNATFALYEANVSPSDLFNDNGTMKTGSINVEVKRNNGAATAAVHTPSTNNGILTLERITNNRIYLLFETAAPEGYSKSKAPWLLYVKNDGTYRLFKSNSTDTNATSWDASTFRNNELIGGDAGKLKNEPFDVWFVKGDIASSSVSIPDAEFELYYAKIDGNNYKVDTAKGSSGKVTNLLSGVVSFNDTDNKYHININRPASGTAYYLLVERKAQDGYILPKTPWLLTVNEYGDYNIYRFTDEAAAAFETAHANETSLTMSTLEIPVANINVSVSNNKLLNEKEQIKITKVRGNAHDNLTTDGVVGAKFEIFRTKIEDNRYVKDGTPIATLESKADGIITLPRVISATSGEKYYWLQETSAAPGYQLSDRPWLVKVNNGALQSVMIAGSTYVEGQGIGKVANGNWDYITVYPKNYNNTPRIHNKPLKFKKVSAGDTNKALGNVKFRLYKVANTGDGDGKNGNVLDWAAVADWSGWTEKNLAKGAAVGEQVTSGAANGEFTFSVNEAGWYFIFEETVANGYRDNTNVPWLLIINEDGTYQLRSNNKSVPGTESGGTKYWNASNFVQTAENGTELVLKNEPWSGIELDKVGLGNEPVNGAVFDIYAVNENGSKWETAYSPNTGTHARKYATVTTAGGKLDITSAVIEAVTAKSSFRNFLLIETGVPAGSVYEKAKAPWLITLNDDGQIESVKLHEEARNADYAGYDTKGDAGQDWRQWDKSEFKPVDSKKLVNEWKPFKFKKVSATDQSKGIADVKFRAYKINNWYGDSAEDQAILTQIYESGNWSTYTKDLDRKNATAVGTGQSTTDNNGEFTITFNSVGAYFIFEESVPDGYVDNRNRPWLLIIKPDGTHLLGRHNGNTGNATENNNGPNWWTLKNFVKIDNGSELTLVNERKPVELTKVRSTTLDQHGVPVIDTSNIATIGGAKFKLYKAIYNNDRTHWIKSEEVGTNLVSDTETGIISLPRIVAETSGDRDYWLEETDPAPGYEKSKTPWIIWVKNGKLKQVYRFNTYVENSGQIKRSDHITVYSDSSDTGPQGTAYIHNEPLKIYKTNEAGDAFLPGAVFEVNSCWEGAYYVQKGLKPENRWGEVSSTDGGVIDLTEIVEDHIGTGEKVEFFLTEKTPPPGHEIETKPWRVMVTKTGEITITIPSSDTFHHEDSNAEYWNKSFAPHDGIYLKNKAKESVFTKVDSNTKQGLQNARFDLKYAKKIDGTYQVDTSKGTDGLYGTLQSTAGGVVNINDLDPEVEYEFLLFETAAPSSEYMRELAPWYIKAVDGEITEMKKYVPEDKYSYSESTTSWAEGRFEDVSGNQAENHKVYDLPSSGGMGTYWFMIIGAMMMTFAVTAALTRKFSSGKL